jgi:TolA-binding protein
VAQLELDRTEDAWKTLATLTERFPHSKALPPARLRLAEGALAAHQLDRAAEQFRAVAGIDPTRRGSKPGGRDRSDEASDPALRVRALAGLGWALRERGTPAEAAKAFAAALDVAPDDPIAPELALAQGRALEASGQADAALEVYSRTVERFAKSDQGPLAALAKARLLSKLSRSADAARVLELLISDPHARDCLTKADAPVDALLADWGWALVDAAQLHKADRVFTRLLKDHPESPYAADARFNLAESANLAHNYREVIRLLTPLTTAKLQDLKIGPRQTTGKTRTVDPTGTTASGAGLRAPEGLPVPGAAPATYSFPSDSSRRLLPAVLYRLGRTQMELRDWAAASATLDHLLEDYPDNSYRREARFLRAESALRQGDAATAESGLAALLARPSAPTDPPGFSRLVRLKQFACWVALKRWKEVLKAAPLLKAELASHDSSMAELDFARGQALLGLGQIEEARTAFQAVVDGHCGGDLEAQAQLMCGETFFHQEQFHAALREFLKVDILYQVPQWQAAALLEAGKVYERLDQWADAAETYERLAGKFPMDPSAAEARVRREVASRRASTETAGRPSSAPAPRTVQPPSTAAGGKG